MKLGIPTCFYGQYETDKEDERAQTTKKELADAFGFSTSQEKLARTETRSIFIIHDLNKMKFGKKRAGEKLTIRETKCVLKEIARIHATSWVLQMKSAKTSLFDAFPFLLHPRRAVPVCVVSLQTTESSIDLVFIYAVNNSP